MTLRLFNKFVLYVTLVLSFYAWLELYLNASTFWLPIGLFLFIATQSIVFKKRTVSNIFSGRHTLNYFTVLTVIFSLFVLYSSSIYGLALILFKLPIYDKSYFIFPYVITILIIAGSLIDST